MSDQGTGQATEEYSADTAVTWGAPGVESAPIPLRVLAYIADLCVAATVVAIGAIINVLAGLELGWVFLGVGAGVAIIGSIVLHGLFGASPGKMLADIKVVDAHSFQRIGFPSSAIRSIVFNVLAPLVYLPGWSVLADSNRRGIHEKASKSTVVDGADVVVDDARASTSGTPSGALGGLVTGDQVEETGLQRIPTPLPSAHADAPTAAAASPASETEVLGTGEPRERLQPPTLPPLPDDVPGLRPVPPRFGPPPAEGEGPTAPQIPSAAAFAPPAQPAQQPPAQPQQPQQPQGLPPQGPPQAPRPTGPVGPGPQVPPAAPRPAGPAQPPRPSAPVPLQAGGGAPIVLRFDDGHSVDVRGDGIIGREPVVPANLDASKVTKHVLVDDTASVSKSHLLFGITRGELWVEDVGSTNGSAIAYQDSWTELTKGVRYAVEKGSVVHMGQRSFKVFGG